MIIKGSTYSQAGVQVIMKQVLQIRGNSGKIHFFKFAGRAGCLDEW